MRELSYILRFAEDRAPQPVILATVVRVEGSHYRRVGAQLAFDSAGAVAGALGGNCLDADLLKRAESVFHDGQSVLAEYDLSSDSDVIWGLGLGCGGNVTILLERLDNSATLKHLTFLESHLDSRNSATLVTVFSSSHSDRVRPGERLSALSDSTIQSDVHDSRANSELLQRAQRSLLNSETSTECLQFDDIAVEALIEYIPPPLSVIICGAGEDAVPLAKFASELGWVTTLVDHRRSMLNQQRFPDVRQFIHCAAKEVRSLTTIDRQTAAVILTHNFHVDLDLAREFLLSEIPYVGLLGARTRTATLVRELLQQSPELKEQLARLHSPVGLDIGAESPETIALSIAAEIQAVFTGRRGAFLCDGDSEMNDTSTPVLTHAQIDSVTS